MLRDLLHILEFIWEIGQTQYVYGPAVGLLLGLVSTQFVKFSLPFRRWVVRVVAIGLAGGVTLYLAPDGLGLVLAAVAGMLCPMLYQVLVWRLYKRWPKLESILSKGCPE